MPSRPLLLSAFLVLATTWVVAPVARPEGEVVELIPDESAGFSGRNLIGLVRRGYYHGERKLRIRTTPPDATLDLFYIRAGFQKMYEQAEAPVTVLLPKRIQAGPRDNVMIRAFVEGFRHKETSVRIDSDREDVLIELEPLPNRLDAIAHVYLAGRTSLGLLLKESPTVRVQNRDDGFNVILAETARGDALDDLSGLRSPVISEVVAQQLGEDLLVQVAFAEGVSGDDGMAIRSRQNHDAIRNVYRYAVDLVPEDGGAEGVNRARAALARIDRGDVTGCNAVFDEALRAELDREALARALAPRGEFTDPFLRVALKRLGEVSPGGVIRLEDGSEYRPAIPLELGAAALQAASARGYLALLRSFVEQLEPEPYRRESLRGLVAPEMDPVSFGKALTAARAAETACRQR